MIDLGKFKPFIYPSLPEVSDMEFISNTRRACIEFCRRSLVWQVELNPIDVVSGQVTYALEIPEDTELTRVMKVIVNRDEYTPINDDAGQFFGFAPYYVSHITSREIDLIRPPQDNIAGGLKIKVALQPTHTAMQVADILYTHYSEAIALGALANLCSIAGRPFSNPQLAKQYTEDFRHAINNATSDAVHGFSLATFNTQEAYI